MYINRIWGKLLKIIDFFLYFIIKICGFRCKIKVNELKICYESFLRMDYFIFLEILQLISKMLILLVCF